MCGLVGCENWGEKVVFLIGICCGLSETMYFGRNVGDFNRGLLVFI